MTKAQISSGALIVGLLLTATACGSSASSQPAAPVATASDAALACYSSDYKPPTEDLRSVSPVRPDGVWTATGSGTSFTVKQTVVGLSDDLEYKCNAEMQPNGDWTAKWYGLPASIYSLSLIHISEPTRRTPISYAVFCLKKAQRYEC